MELRDEIRQIEGIDESSEDFLTDAYKDPNNLETWRKLLLSYKEKKRRLEDIINARDIIVKKYNDSIEKKEWELEHMKAFMINQIEYSNFNTESGGKKIDHFPDIGVFSISKKSPKFDVVDEQYFLSKGFSRVVPEETKIDKKALNEYLKSCDVSPSGKIIDPNTGELIENILVRFESNVTFKGVE